MVSKEFAAVKMVILRIAGLGAPHRSDLRIVVICPEEDLIKLLNELGCITNDIANYIMVKPMEKQWLNATISGFSQQNMVIELANNE